MSTTEPDAGNKTVGAMRNDTEARGETFYPGPSRIHLAATRYGTGAVATAFTNRA